MTETPVKKRFRKRAIVVEAYQHHGPKPLYVDTLEGRMRADPGDWIITGINGETYPCKPEIFEQVYEADN